jgi:UPF0271 protein
MGESFGHYKLGLDEEIIKYISSANIGCGFHGGDPLVMRKTVKMAKERGVGIGAHPGLPDLVGFGRRLMDVSPLEVRNDVLYQIGSLYAFARAEGTQLQHVKPHGALYNVAAQDEKLGRAVIEAIGEFDRDLILVGLAGSRLLGLARKMGLKVASEAFADRAYNSDGSLVSRRLRHAVITDRETVVSRAIQMVMNQKVISVDGEPIEVKVDTICLHGDNPEAVQLARTLRARLEEAGISVVPMGKFL